MASSGYSVQRQPIVIPGTPGPRGETGPGVPASGASGSILTKQSTTDYDTAWLTRAALGADTDLLTAIEAVLDSRYAPLAGAVVHVPASAFREVGVGPTISAAGSWLVAWTLDGAAAESIGTSWVAPAGWNTVDIVVYWANGGAGAGGVALQGRLTAPLAAGATVANNVPTTPVITAAGAQNILKRTTIYSGLAVAANSLNLVVIARLPTDAGDTLANDVLVYGIDLVRAT